jgi:hypothetical protein
MMARSGGEGLRRKSGGKTAALQKSASRAEVTTSFPALYFAEKIG